MFLDDEVIKAIWDQYSNLDRLGLGDLLEKRDEINSRISMYNSYPSYDPDLVKVYKEIYEGITNRINQIGKQILEIQPDILSL